MGGANCVETSDLLEAGCYLDLSLSADTARASDSPRLWSSPNDGYLVIWLFGYLVIWLFSLNNSQTIKVVIPASLSSRRREGGNPLQINNLVQVMDARLLGHDNIEVF